jgi:hypothetical protein
MKKTLIAIIFILMTSAELYSASDRNGQEDSKSLPELMKTPKFDDLSDVDDSLLYCDTIFKHNTKEIDGHLVIQDTIIIEKVLQHEVEKFIQDDSNKPLEKVMVILVFTFVISALIYRKKKNG